MSRNITPVLPINLFLGSIIDSYSCCYERASLPGRITWLHHGQDPWYSAISHDELFEHDNEKFSIYISERLPTDFGKENTESLPASFGRHWRNAQKIESQPLDFLNHSFLSWIKGWSGKDSTSYRCQLYRDLTRSKPRTTIKRRKTNCPSCWGDR
jgi:hypothetical protein